jgi:hypothetical protein
MNKVSSTNNDTIKREMIEALKTTLGVVSPACEIVGISRNTHYTWMNNDPEYKEAVESLLDFQIDFVESKLFENINNGDTGSAIFYLKTKAKHRGYIERSELKIETEKPIFNGINLDVPEDNSTG